MRKTLRAAAARLSRGTLVGLGLLAAVGAAAAVAAVGASQTTQPAKEGAAGARPASAAASLKAKRGPRGPRGPRGFRGPQGPAGPAGATGQAGATGAAGQTGATGQPGPPGPSNATEVVLATTTVNTALNTYFTLAKISSLPAGSYVIFAKATQTATGPDTLISSCQLVAGGNTDTSSSTAPINGLIDGGPQATHNMQLTQTFAAATGVSLQCKANYGTWTASNVSIIAIHVGEVTRVG